MLADSIVWKVMLGASLLGAAAGFVGTFAVLRRRALLGDMLSHAALPGIAIAFMLWQTRDLVSLSIGALVAGLLGVAVVAAIRRWTRTSDDAALGIVLSTFFGTGVVLLTVLQDDPNGNKAGLDSFLFGEVASLRSRDVTLILTTAAVLLTLVTLLYKELKLLSFDTGFAAAQGWPTFWLDLVVMAAVALVTVIGLPICGVVLMAAMLIAPAAAARFWTNRLGAMLAIAALLGALAGVIGCLVAAPTLLDQLGLRWLALDLQQNLPPGPLIVLAGAVLLVGSMMFAPQRGLVSRMWVEWQMRRRIARDHLLRAVYELSPAPESDLPWIEAARLARHGGWSPARVDQQTRRAERQGMLLREAGRLRLTDAGYRSAAQLVRAHRLWELYMLGTWDRSPDRVHSGADAIEHALPAEIVEELENMLQQQGRLPPLVPGDVPRSPHAIGTGQH